MLHQPEKCSRAILRCLAGRMWTAGRTLPIYFNDELVNPKNIAVKLNYNNQSQ
jgi:hypothetical protein